MKELPLVKVRIRDEPQCISVRGWYLCTPAIRAKLVVTGRCAILWLRAVPQKLYQLDVCFV